MCSELQQAFQRNEYLLSTDIEAGIPLWMSTHGYFCAKTLQISSLIRTRGTVRALNTAKLSPERRESHSIVFLRLRLFKDSSLPPPDPADVERKKVKDSPHPNLVFLEKLTSNQHHQMKLQTYLKNKINRKYINL